MLDSASLWVEGIFQFGLMLQQPAEFILGMHSIMKLTFGRHQEQLVDLSL